MSQTKQPRRWNWTQHNEWIVWHAAAGLRYLAVRKSTWTGSDRDGLARVTRLSTTMIWHAWKEMARRGWIKRDRNFYGSPLRTSGGNGVRRPVHDVTYTLLETFPLGRNYFLHKARRFIRDFLAWPQDPPLESDEMRLLMMTARRANRERVYSGDRQKLANDTLLTKDRISRGSFTESEKPSAFGLVQALAKKGRVEILDRHNGLMFRFADKSGVIPGAGKSLSVHKTQANREAIIGFIDARNGQAISAREIADAVGCSRGIVCATLSWLRDRGHIRIQVRSASPKGTTSNRYWALSDLNGRPIS